MIAARLAIAVTLLLPGLAQAQDAVSRAIDTERFRPTADPEGGILLSGSRVGTPWEIDLAAWVHASRNPLVRVADDGQGRGPALIEGRVGARLQVGWNIGRRVRLAADLPLTLHQNGLHPHSGEALPGGGIGDIRLEPKVMILDPTEKPLGVAFGLPISFPTGREDALLGDPGPTIQPRVTLEGRPASVADPRVRFSVAGDFGWRFRPRTQLAGLDTTGEFTFAVGARWTPSDRFRVGTEIAGAVGSGDAARNAEWISWARGSFGKQRRIEVQGGVALGMAPGVGTPEGRVFVGVRTRIDPRKRRLDAVVVEDVVEPSRAEPRAAHPTPPVPESDDFDGWGLRLVGRKPSIRSEVLFEFDSARLTDAGEERLEDLARWLVEHPSVRRVEVHGHADRRGTHAYNDTLSRRRAEAVVDFMLARGVGADRLGVRAFGERKPSSGGSLDADRRVDFQVVDGPTDAFAEAVQARPRNRSYRTEGRSSRRRGRR